MISRPILLLILCLFSLSATAQNAVRFAQGIRQEKAIFYETEGYDIFFQEFPFALNDANLNKVRRKYDLPKKLAATEDSNFPQVKILTHIEMKGTAKIEKVYYVSASKEGKTWVIGFTTVCGRVPSIEKEFYEAIMSNTLPEHIFTPMVIHSIQFAGRGIELGNACLWRGVRNVQCDRLGQMNWSEFSNPERAKQMIEGQKALNANLKMGEVLEDTEVDIKFEGQPAKALKRKLKIKIPKFIMGGSNILIVYYVMAEVRGRYVACVLSHYLSESKDGELPPLLGEVMELKK